MKKILVTLLKYIIGFGIGGFLVWWSLHNLTTKDLSNLKAALLRARFWLVLPVFAILLTSHYFRALRWKQMLKSMGYSPPAFHLLCAILTGYIGNQLIPRAGEVLRCTVITRKDKIPVEKLIGTIIVERAIDLLCLAILCVIVFFAQYDHIRLYADEIFAKTNASMQQDSSGRWIKLAIVAGIVLLLIVVIRRFGKTRWGAAVSKVLKGMWEGLLSIKKVQHKFLFFVYTVLIWLCYITSTWIGCYALTETAGLSFATATTLLIFGTFGIIVAPGGLGAYPIAIQKTLGFYNIDSNIGLAVGWLLWLAQFIFTLIFGTLGYIALTMSKHQHEEHSLHTSKDI